MVSLHRYSVVVGLSSRAGLGSVRSIFPIRRSDNQLLSFGRMVFFSGRGGERLTILVKFGCSLARRGENVAKISACPRWLLLLSPLRQTLS